MKWTRTRSLTVLAALTVLLAGPAYACSGPGAPTMILANRGIGFLGLIACLVLLALAVYLQAKRRGVTARTALMFLPLLPFPLTLITTSPDCGRMLRQSTFVLVAITALFALIQIALFLIQKSKRIELGMPWFLPFCLLTLAGFVAAAAPLDPDPPPVQQGYMRYEYGYELNKFRGAIEEYLRRHKVYPDSFLELNLKAPEYEQLRGDLFVDCHDNGDGDANPKDWIKTRGHFYKLLQGTTDNPTGWRAEDGLSDWAVTARPVNFGRPDVYQYLFDSKGGIWRKPDPGNDEFLLDAMPPDPAADGWERVE